jgi:hypothetical protein
MWSGIAFPTSCPNGRHFIFFREQKGIWAGSLDSPEIKQIGDVRSVVVYAAPGWLLFVQNDVLVRRTANSARTKSASRVGAANFPSGDATAANSFSWPPTGR